MDEAAKGDLTKLKVQEIINQNPQMQKAITGLNEVKNKIGGKQNAESNGTQTESGSEEKGNVSEENERLHLRNNEKNRLEAEEKIKAKVDELIGIEKKRHSFDTNKISANRDKYDNLLNRTENELEEIVKLYNHFDYLTLPLAEYYILKHGTADNAINAEINAERLMKGLNAFHEWKKTKSIPLAESKAAKFWRFDNIPVNENLFNAIGIKKKEIKADYGALWSKHLHEFKDPLEVKNAVEYVLTNPEFSIDEGVNIGLVREGNILGKAN